LPTRAIPDRSPHLPLSSRSNHIRNLRHMGDNNRLAEIGPGGGAAVGMVLPSGRIFLYPWASLSMGPWDCWGVVSWGLETNGDGKPGELLRTTLSEWFFWARQIGCSVRPHREGSGQAGLSLNGNYYFGTRMRLGFFLRTG
jgi:hypothetical protein